MKRSQRGAVRVSIVWMVVTLVMFFVALFIAYTAFDAKAKAVADVHKKFEDMMGLRLDRYNQVRDIAGAMAYTD